MKIGLVCPYGVDRGGGVKEVIYSIQDELNKRGHQAYIITPRPQSDNFQQRERMIFVGRATDMKSPSRTTVQISASVNDTIDRMLEEEKFDVLHFHEPWIPMLSYQLLTRSNTVNVATFHANLPETTMVRTLAKVITPYAKSILKYIDSFTATSDAAAEYICSLTDAPVAIIPIGLDASLWKPPEKHKDGTKHKTILYVGRLEGRKGVSYLIHAFAELQNQRPEISLLICGEGPDRDKLEMLVEDLEVKNVTFMGYISDAQKHKLYQTSDLFCSPAIYGEGFGLVLLEAMASGLVTVAGDNPGYKGVMNGLGALSLINPKHTAEFARRLDLLLYEKDLRKLWRYWASKEMPQYSYKNIVNQYLEVYEQAIAEASEK